MMAKSAAHTFVHQEELSQRTDSLFLNEQAQAIKIFPLHQYSEDHNAQNLFHGVIRAATYHHSTDALSG